MSRRAGASAKKPLSIARLNHPNIATVHEFGSQDGIDFLVTEYIAGITLDVKLARGPLEPAEVLRLGKQLADGLAAAHHQGIIHCDLKPGNLRLTEDGRLKILDFGLARIMPRASELGLTMTATQPQQTSGTLPYMSPEQLKGEIADASTDIWSAGAVLYEMATGKRPFSQVTPALVIDAILNHAPEPPSKLNPAVPAGLENAILKALARDRSIRYGTASDLRTDLERPETSTSPGMTIPAPGRRTSRAPIAIALAGLLLIAVATAGYLIVHRRSRAASSHPSAAVSKRHSVAVMGFKNLSMNPEESWLSTALSEMLTTELSEGDQLRTIPGETVAQMKASLALPDADSFGQQTLARIRQNLGSDDVVVGSYLALGDGLLRLDVRLQDAVAGETLASISEKGSESEIDGLVSKAGAELRSKLGVSALSDEQLASVRASLPSNPEAARLYSQGLQNLRLFDALAARDSLEKAAALASDYAPTHSALAEAWSALGYDAKAKEQAKRALDLSAQASREERLLIEGRSHEILGENQQAVDSYSALWEFFPDNIDYGLFLVRAQIAAGHGKEAEGTLDDLRKLNASDADGARIDLADAYYAASQGDFKRQQAMAERAASRGQAVGANLLVAQALQVEVEAMERMGQSQKVIDLSNQARDLYAAAGDRRGAARNFLIVGDMLYDEGHYEDSKQEFEKAVPVFREIGATKSLRAALERIGNVFYQEGKLRESEKYYSQVLDFDHELNDPSGLASDYGNMANALDGLGDLTGALKMQQDSLSAFNDIGDRRGASTTLNNLGNLFVEMGRLDDARKDFEQSLAMTREIAYRRGEPYPTGGLGDALYYGGDLAHARTQYEQALALCKEVDDEDFAAQMTMSLGAIALAEKRYTEGEPLAAQAIAAFEKSNSGGSEAWSQAYLARIRLGAGDLNGAQSAAQKAMSVSRQTTLQTPRYEAVLADARVKAKSGKTADARQELESALASAHKFGYRLYELQIRLATGEIELSSKSATGRTQLAEVEKDAKSLGATLIANQAQALLQAK